MRLKFELPIEVSREVEGDILYALPFDLSFDGKSEEGNVVITKSLFYIFKNKVLEASYPLEKLQDCEAKQLVGSGLFSAKIDEEEQMICGFKPKWFKRYVELAKLINYYHKTGEHSTYEEEQEEYICPKCGFPLLNGSKTCFKCQSKTKVLRKIFAIGKDYKKVFLYTLLGTLVMEVLWIVNPYILRVIIDDYIVPKNQNVPHLLILLAVYLTVFATITWFERFVMKWTNLLSNSISRDLRNQVFVKIQELSLSTVSNRTPGELMNRINSDTEKIQEFISNYGRDAINRIFSLIVLSILLFVMDYRLALMVLVPLPPVLYAVTKMQDKMGLRYWKQWRKHEKASSALHDILSGIRVVKAYGNEEIEIKKYTENVDQVKDAMINAETLWSKFYPYIGYLMGLGEFLVLWMGGYLVLGGKMQLGQLIQYTTYITMIYVPLRWAIQLPRVFADVFVSAGKVFELLDEECEMEEIDEPIKKEIIGDVVFQDVSFGYKVYEPVLKDVSFEVKAGEMIGIVGHSGAGKSTLINLLMRLYDVADGKITIDGIDIRSYSTQVLRSQIGVVLQETFLFEGTIIDNLRYAKPDATLDEIIEAAKVANAHEFIVKLPDAYHTVIGEKGHTLSGGERQRVAIARAVLHNPKILILDEATSALDTETEKKIQEALERLKQGKTTFAIAHRLSTLQKANRLLVIDKGTFAEMGTHEELLEKKGIYYNLVMAQKQTTHMKQ